MTQEADKRLPRETEFQEKREELTAVFGRLEELCEYTNDIGSKWSRPVYIQENGEVFEMSFDSVFEEGGRVRKLEIEALRTYRGEIWGNVPGKGRLEMRKERDVLDHISYNWPIRFSAIKENPYDQFIGTDGKEIASTNALNEAIEIATFFGRTLFSRKATDRNKALGGIPKPLVTLIGKLRGSEALEYVYAGKDFRESMEKIKDKLDPVEADDSEYERMGHLTKSTTGWVRVQKDGVEFELMCSEIGYSSNGGWDETEEISRREVGEVGDGWHLFSSRDIDRSSFFSDIKTAKQVRECIEILELLESALIKAG